MKRRARREEIEVKLNVSNVTEFRRRLKQLHAREIVPRTWEFNTLYDTPSGDLRRRGQLIRIRIERRAAKFGKRSPNNDLPAVLTYKGPSRASSRAAKSARTAKIPGHFKVKEEAEVQLSGAGEIDRILRALGLKPSFRYEKFRTTYSLPGASGLKIELDETPIGVYLELEGTVAGINRAAHLLGYGHDDYRKDSYGALYLADCRRRRRKPGNMLFPPLKKSR
ncbi:MAG TPA: class IV adenylate cyclase [Candidatus Acidoferrales bacterium]|nr:class IV adenylate cyclase [Candidatus Acidoferrales bacterium]